MRLLCLQATTPPNIVLAQDMLHVQLVAVMVVLASSSQLLSLGCHRHYHSHPRCVIVVAFMVVLMLPLL